MEYNEVKQIIDDNIKTNTSQDITAIVANAVMTAMIDYTRDSFTEAMNQGAGGGAFSWLDVRADTVIPYPPMSAGRARVVRILKDGVEYPAGEATIGGANGVVIKHHALVICLEATNESANDGSQEAVGDRFAVINVDGSGSSLTLEQARQNGNVLEGGIFGDEVFPKEDDLTAYAQLGDYLELQTSEFENVPFTLTPSNSYINTSGEVIPSMNWGASEPISVEGGEFYLYYGQTTVGAAIAVASYDSEGDFIGALLTKVVSTTVGVPFTIPEGVTTIRICSYSGSALNLKKRGESRLKIKETLLPLYLTKRIMNMSWGAIGHSIWSNDGTYNGFQTLIQQKFNFTSVATYGYSGSSLGGTSSEDTHTILNPARTNLWTAKDIFTVDSITNDFRRDIPIGSSDDFINNTGITTYYGALRVLHEKLKSLNPSYICICMNALKRNNGGYTSWSENAEGHTLEDYSEALEWVANRLSWRFVNQFRDSGINDDNLTLFTYDGLHLNNQGYLRCVDLLIHQFDIIYMGLPNY